MNAKKFFSLILASLAVTASLCACGREVTPVKLTGDTVTKTVYGKGGADGYEVDIENLSFYNDAYVNIHASDEVYVVAKYNSDLDDYGFTIEAADGKISIGCDNRQFIVEESFILDIYAPVTKLTSSGVYTLSFDASRSKTLEVEITGASGGRISSVNAQTLKLKVAGAASIELSGSVAQAEIQLDGASRIKGETLVCADAEIEVNGAGIAELSVSDTLSAEINGVGEISYYGSPQIVRELNGVGKLTQKSTAVRSE